MPSSLRRPAVERARPLLGTLVAIRVGGLSEAEALHAVESGFSAVAEIHRLMSFHESSSDVSRLNRGAFDRPVMVHPHSFEVVRRSLEIAAASRGAFDITVAGKLVAWGFLPRPDGAQSPDPAANWRDIELIGADRIRFRRRLWIDLGGIAKGYAVDRAIDAMGLGSDIQCRVNAGGDLRVAGPRAERAALRAVASGGDLIPVLEIENGSIASSSGQESYRRFQGRLVGPHLDGIGRRTVGTRSFVSVVAERCVVADALTKVVLAKGRAAEPVLRRYGAIAHIHNARDGWRSLGVAA